MNNNYLLTLNYNTNKMRKLVLIHQLKQISKALPLKICIALLTVFAIYQVTVIAANPVIDNSAGIEIPGYSNIPGEPGLTSEDSATCVMYYCNKAEKKVTLCHIPPGNDSSAHEICIPLSAVEAHIREHGCYCGPCMTEIPGHKRGLSEDYLEESDALVTIYPNPANNLAIVEIEHGLFHSEGNFSLQLFDLLGRQILNIKDIQEEKTTIDLSGLSQGIYSYTVLKSNELIHSGNLVKN